MPLRSTKLLSITSPPATPLAATIRPTKAKPKAKLKGKPKAKGSKASTRVAVAAAAIAEIAPLFKQEQPSWDWAACAQMVAASKAISPPISPLPSQEDIARNQLGAVTDLNQAQGVNQIVSLYTSGKAGAPIRCFSHNGVLSQDQLDEQLQAGIPVQMGLDLNSCKHLSLVVGIEDSDNGPLYIVHDPAFGRGRFTYNGLLSAYGRGQWFMTFGGFERQ